MRNFRLLLAYDGSRYRGWQRLGDSDHTIQGKLEQVLSRMVQAPVEVIGSGRTDAGVHATGQTAAVGGGRSRIGSSHMTLARDKQY